MTDASGILHISPVIPVVTLDDPEDAVPLARALVDGGVKIIELTLRSETALTSLKRITDEVDGIFAGAGTILTPEQADAAASAGGQFLVSPGVTPALLAHMLSLQVPVLPGVATVSEVMAVLESGLNTMKFFPAGPAGGPDYLAAIGAPVPRVEFCPTGGISPSTARDYLKLSNVPCVGGSWLAPSDVVAAKDWNRISSLAREATTLGA
jgi:2-dehydro-3-deoxyphosphogluconate aldolase/(4S)-4-hydroxy-2-oxoglutarate aldolase